jgi:hypothetical protein
MLSIFKRKNNNQEVPEWASFFDKKEYATFINGINSYFKNYSFHLEDGVVKVDSDDFGFENLGLTNVAQVCKQSRKGNYKRIISEHFNSMIRTHKFEKEFKKIEKDFDKVKDYIGVRLYDNEYVSHIGKGLTIGKDFAGDVYAMVVFDFPDSVLNVQPSQISTWGKTIEELFQLGLKNIKTNYPINLTKEKLENISVWFAQSDHFFTSNIVFDINEKTELVGKGGTLIGLPHRHASILYPIDSLEVVDAVNKLIPIVYGMNNEGPGALSNNLFWFYEGKFTQLPYSIDGGKLSFSPTEEFVAVLNDLKDK